MRLAALVSGGKDSLYAAYLASKEHEIKYIVSIISENPESYMFHVPNAKLVKKQAEAMQIPLIQMHTAGEKEEELKDLKDALSKIKNNIDGVVTGAIQSNYQKTRIDNLCKELGIVHISPLWQKDSEALLRQMLVDDFEIIITAVGAQPLDEKWLGRKIDEKIVNELISLNQQYGISIIGEGGEFESFVLNCPLFKKQLIIVSSEKHWDEKTRSGTLKINLG